MANEKRLSANNEQELNEFDREFAAMEARQMRPRRLFDDIQDDNRLPSPGYTDNANISHATNNTLSSAGNNGSFTSSDFNDQSTVGSQNVVARRYSSVVTEYHNNMYSARGNESLHANNHHTVGCAHSLTSTGTGFLSGDNTSNSGVTSTGYNPNTIDTSARNSLFQYGQQSPFTSSDFLPSSNVVGPYAQQHTYPQRPSTPNLRGAVAGDAEDEEGEEEGEEQASGDGETEVGVSASQVGQRASSRQSRSRWWPRRSDPHQIYPSVRERRRELGNNTIELGTGEDSGRNRFAIFADAGPVPVPRLAYNIRVTGRGGAHWPGYSSPQDVVLPIGMSLADMLSISPNHVWNDGLRLFMAEGWQAEAMWRGLPSDARNSGASTRPWNYLQQALGREADKIAREVTGRKRVPEKRPKKEDHEQEEEEQEGEDE